MATLILINFDIMSFKFIRSVCFFHFLLKKIFFKQKVLFIIYSTAKNGELFLDAKN